MTILITASELVGLNKTELQVKLHHVWQDLARSEQGSEERVQALASLENIERALCYLLLDSTKP